MDYKVFIDYIRLDRVLWGIIRLLKLRLPVETYSALYQELSTPKNLEQ